MLLHLEFCFKIYSHRLKSRYIYNKTNKNYALSGHKVIFKVTK